MSVDKLVDSSQLDSDLTTIANAIRTKGGTSDALGFPSGFVSAIENIPTGGSPGDWDQISAVASANLSTGSDVKNWLDSIVPSSTVAIITRNDYDRNNWSNNGFVIGTYINNVPSFFVRWRNNDLNIATNWTSAYALVINKDEEYSILYIPNVT